MKYPDGISSECHDLLTKLFVVDPTKRLGSGPTGGDEIMNHPWFAGVDWNAIKDKKIKPPFKPKLQSATDVKNFDTMFTGMSTAETPAS